MTAELANVQKKLETMDDEFFGAIIYEAVNEEDNFPIDMAESLIDAYRKCETDAEFQTADRVLTALTGYHIDTLIRRYDGVC